MGPASAAVCIAVGGAAIDHYFGWSGSSVAAPPADAATALWHAREGRLETAVLAAAAALPGETPANQAWLVTAVHDWQQRLLDLPRPTAGPALQEFRHEARQ